MTKREMKKYIKGLSDLELLQERELASDDMGISIWKYELELTEDEGYDWYNILLDEIWKRKIQNYGVLINEETGEWYIDR